MRILFLGNNWVAWQVVRWLKEQDEHVVGLVLHPPDKRKYGEEIISAVQLEPSCIFAGSQLDEAATQRALKALEPDLALSVLFDYILSGAFLDIFPLGVINLHPSYLPYNRGQYPNVWSIVEGTPAGVTLHYVDGGVDTGDIIAQQRVAVDPADTGESLYRTLERACVQLFKRSWPDIRSGQAPRIPQDKDAGTHHRTRDVDQIDRIDLDREYKARELIDIIRARTFPPYRGAYFMSGGQRVYLRLELWEEQEASGVNDDPLS